MIYNHKGTKNYWDYQLLQRLSYPELRLTILRKLGYEDIDEDSPTPSVPCIIIYPKEDGDSDNPFKSNKLRDLCTWHLKKSRGFTKSASQFQLLADKREKYRPVRLKLSNTPVRAKALKLLIYKAFAIRVSCWQLLYPGIGAFGSSART